LSDRYGPIGARTRSGWYRDPDRSHKQRFWDGSAWTDWVTNGDGVFQEPAGSLTGHDGPTDPSPSLHRAGRFSGRAKLTLALILWIAAVFAFIVWDNSRIVGEVTAEQLSSDYATDREAAKARYDGQLWVITGVVVADDSGTTLAGAASTPNVYLSWADSDRELPETGDAVRAVCRIKLRGWGLWDGWGDQSRNILALDCRDSESHQTTTRGGWRG
jgi:hypothetical protein